MNIGEQAIDIRVLGGAGTATSIYVLGEWCLL